MPLSIRRIRTEDAVALGEFYNGLSPEAIRTFRPLGVRASADACANVVRGNEAGNETRYDLIAADGDRIVGWCFLWDLQTSTPSFGLAIADGYRGRRLGSSLMDLVMNEARERGLKQVILTVVKDNAVAWRLYEKRGFARYGEFVDAADGQTYLRMRWEEK